MAVTLLFPKQKVQLGSVVLDTAVTEHHGVSVEVTKHPVEDGASVSDHRRVQPRSVTIEGVISNTPIPEPSAPKITQSFRNQFFTSQSTYDPKRASNAYLDLLALANSNDLVTLITTMETYKNMTLTQLDVPRDAKTGEAVKFTASFLEIRIVNNAQVQVSKTLRGQKLIDKHKKTSPDASQPQVKKSVAASFIDFVQSKWGAKP
jgi:hypothetical protein